MPDNLSKNNLKQQRERFLSFAFAASDLLLEIAENGSISYALGTIKNFTGQENADALIGTSWLDLFVQKDHISLKHMISQSTPGHRCGPMLVYLNHAALDKEGDEHNDVIVSAITMPGKKQIYISVAASNALMNQLGKTEKQKHKKTILDKESFIESAHDVLRMASDMNQDVDLTMIHLLSSEQAQNRFGKDVWSLFSENINSLLRDYSVDGNAAANLGAGHFSLLHTPNAEIDKLTEQISVLSKTYDPFNEGLDIQSKSISANMEDMDEKDVTRALFYTLNEFERTGAQMNIQTLNSSFKVFVTSNTQKVREFKNIIQALDFNLNFQPIVNLGTRNCSHYEMLSRFKSGDTLEWIMFGEGIGLAAEFDFAVCRRALNYIETKRWNTKESYAINISGQSISDSAFLIKLSKAIDLHKDIKHRIIFEITESTQIRDLDYAGEVIKKLQKKGVKVALDDFGAGAASFQYLSNMHVDYVKIDGKYIKNILNDTRDMVMVKNLAQMCKDLGIEVIAEYVENEEVYKALLDLGITYGQGYYFGRPRPSPDYKKLSS